MIMNYNKFQTHPHSSSSFRPKAPSVGARMTNVTRKPANVLIFQNQVYFLFIKIFAFLTLMSLSVLHFLRIDHFTEEGE